VQLWSLRLGSGFIFLCGFLFLCMSVVPWRPFYVYDIHVKPKEVCTGELVTIKVDRYLARGLPEYVRDVDIDVTTRWKNEETGKFAAEESFTNVSEQFYKGPYGRHIIESPLLRSTPDEVGEWRLISHYEVHGTPFYVPRHYDFSATGPVLTTTDCRS